MNNIKDLNIKECPYVFDFLSNKIFPFYKLSKDEWVKFLNDENYFPNLTLGHIIRAASKSEINIWKLLKTVIKIIEGGLHGYDKGTKDRKKHFIDSFSKLFGFNEKQTPMNILLERLGIVFPERDLKLKIDLLEKVKELDKKFENESYKTICKILWDSFSDEQLELLAKNSVTLYTELSNASVSKTEDDCKLCLKYIKEYASNLEATRFKFADLIQSLGFTSEQKKAIEFLIK